MCVFRSFLGSSPRVLVTVLLPWRDTTTKSSSKGKHLIEGLLIVSEGPWSWLGAWEYGSWEHGAGAVAESLSSKDGSRETGPTWAFDTPKPTPSDTLPPTRMTALLKKIKTSTEVHGKNIHSWGIPKWNSFFSLMKKYHLGFSRPVSKKSRRKGFGSGPFQRGEPFVFISIPVCGMQIECSLPSCLP